AFCRRGGVLTTRAFRKTRLAVPVALCAAMAGGPALALMHAAAPPSSSPPHVLSGALTVSASAPQQPAPVDDRVAAPDTTVPPAPPKTLATAAYTPVARRVRATTSTAPPTTVARRTATTVKPAPRPAAAPAKPAPKSGSSGAGTAPQGRTQSGGATWYDAAPPGTCAHRTLPMGTVVTIRGSNGATDS